MWSGDGRGPGVQGSRSRGRAWGWGMEGWPGTSAGALGVISPLPLSPACSRPARAGGSGQWANVLSPVSLLCPQNTALDKEGQIFGSKLGAEGSRPGQEPPASRESPPRPCSPAAASGGERPGTWRRHRD